MKYAIFDLDGTLLDSMGIWKDIDIEFLARYDAAPTVSLREKVKVLSVWQACELFKAEFEINRSVAEMAAEIEAMAGLKYREEAQLKPFAREALERLKNRGVRMCIATASTKNNTYAVLERLGIKPYFEFVITGDDVASGKTDPEIYINCADKFGARPCEITVFEDALHAVETAKKAGFRVIGVYDESSEYDIVKIKEAGDVFIRNFGELEGFF